MLPLLLDRMYPSIKHLYLHEYIVFILKVHISRFYIDYETHTLSLSSNSTLCFCTVDNNSLDELYRTIYKLFLRKHDKGLQTLYYIK